MDSSFSSTFQNSFSRILREDDLSGRILKKILKILRFSTLKYTFIRLWKKKRKAEVIIIYSCIINIVPKSSIFKIRKINRWRLWCDSCCRTTKKELGYPASQIRNFCQSCAILRIVLQHPIFQRCNIILFAKTSNGTRFSRLFEPRLVREISIPRTRRRVVSMRLSYFKEHFNIIYDTAMSVFQVFPCHFLFSFFFNSLISRAFSQRASISLLR